MRMKFLVGVAAMLALAGGAAGIVQAQTAPTPAEHAARGAAAQALVDRYVAEGKVPGLVVAVGVGEHPTHYFSAGKISADAGAAPAGPDSLWRVYSMTKPLTGMAAMILVQEGKLKLDQPISDFIPAFKNMRVLDTPDGDSLASHPATHPITVRNLLTHTAGLGYTIITKGALLAEYNRLGLNPAQVNTTLEPNMRSARPATLEAFANQVATLPLVAEPGTKWSYSIGLDVMGRVIEVASGMPFDTFLQKKIFDPLGMKSTYFTVPGSEVGRFATNYFYMGGNRVVADAGAGSQWLIPPSFPYGGAGLVMSARDYDRFLHMLQDHGTLDGVQVMKPETVALGMSDLLPAGTDTSLLNNLGRTGGKLGFGAGGSVYLESVAGSPSKGTYGWGGAAGTIAWIDPVRGVRGTVMVNYMPSEQWPLRADLNKALFADIAP